MNSVWMMVAQVEAGAAAGGHRGLSPNDRTKLMVALAVLMALVIVGGVCILMIRRRLNREEADSAGGANTGFSLADLRDMVERGEMTKEEYERTRERIVAKVRGAAAAQKGQGSRGKGRGEEL